MNCIDGYLYYAYKEGINCLNTENFSEENIVNITDDEGILEVLIYDGYMLYVVENKTNNQCFSYAYDLANKKTVLLKTTMANDYNSDIFFSVSGDKIYCFDYSNKRAENSGGVLLLEFTFDNMQKASDNADLYDSAQMISTSRAKPESWMLTPSGLYEFSSSQNPDGSIITNNMYIYNYESIKFENNEWSSNTSSTHNNEGGHRYLGLATSYLLGDNIFIFDTRYTADEMDKEAEIYYYEKGDLSTEKLIGELPIMRFMVSMSRGICGTYNDNMYIILRPDDTTNVYSLVTVSKDGSIQTVDCN